MTATPPDTPPNSPDEEPGNGSITGPSIPSVPLPAASVLLLREGADGLEILAFQRHGQHRAFAGMLAFPGGKVMDSDHDPDLRKHADGVDGLDDDALAFHATGARELFEECGVLLARDGSGEIVDGTRARALWPNRDPLDKGSLPLVAFLAQEGLRLACDLMAYYSNWITPDFRPKRFDTHFLVAPAPEGQEINHSGNEANEVFWVRPKDILAEVDAFRRRMMFTTYSNLNMLRECRTVAEARAVAAAHPKIAVTPERFKTPEGPRLRIPAEAGYPVTEMPGEIGGVDGVPMMAKYREDR